MIPMAKPIIEEEEKRAVLEVLDSGVLAQGPRVKAFEESFARMCGVRHAVATSSGTTALHTALLAAGIGRGDEVITTPFTFIASANSILYTGARPVFVDIDPETYNIDAAQIEASITSRTRAILPVHLYGLCCDMDPIMTVAEKYHLQVIEDACQAHGAAYHGQKAGSFGIGAFSLYPTKNMTSCEGGMITTNDDAVAEKCRVIRQHGMRRRYYHDEIGFNFRMTDVHAAVGLAQLMKLERFNEARRRNARYLNTSLLGVKVPLEPKGYDHVYHQYTIRVPKDRRETLRSYMSERGVGSEVYYPVPIHRQSFYAGELGYAADHFPHAEAAAEEVLSLPIHPGLSLADLQKIAEIVIAFMCQFHVKEHAR